MYIKLYISGEETSKICGISNEVIWYVKIPTIIKTDQKQYIELSQILCLSKYMFAERYIVQVSITEYMDKDKMLLSGVNIVNHVTVYCGLGQISFREYIKQFVKIMNLFSTNIYVYMYEVLPRQSKKVKQVKKYSFPAHYLVYISNEVKKTRS